MAKTPEKRELFQPWKPPHLELPEVAALQAVAKGTATEHQQRLAMVVIVEKICMRYDDPYCPGQNGDRDTALALGRMRAGSMLTSFLNTPLGRFKDPDAKPTEQP